jgi:uncharacterized protein (TIGR02145 family)
MKYVLIIIVFLFYYSAISQSLSVFDVDTTNFPTMKAKFFAFGADGKQISNFSTSDFELLEDSIKRNVLSVSCPPFQEPKALSSVLTIDVSGSMSGIGLENAKSVATACINGLPLGKSECAITSFSNESYLIQDFTTDRNKLLQSISSLTALNGTDYDVAYWTSIVSGLEIAKRGQYKRVLVFISDGQPNQEPQTQKIIDLANQYNVVVYCVILNMSSPQTLKDISTKTGGLWYENITTEDEARTICMTIQNVSQNVNPCTIEWESNISCKSGIREIEVKLPTIGAVSKTNYKSPSTAISKLEFNPTSVKFKNATPGLKKDTIITVTARNANFTVTNITSSNPAFSITPTAFSLTASQSKNLTVSFVPPDSGYIYCKFTLENNQCLMKYYASGGFAGKQATIRTLKLIKPNGGEEFVVGMDTVITWEGVLPEEKVKIEYSTNNGTDWMPITESAKGLIYNWQVPNTPSNQCLARVTAKAMVIQSGCVGGDIQICNQVWMGCNLDVDTYSNGDPIPEIKNPTSWGKLTTGAWCYYNNDPAMGAIYGKLYNWYAVNDPRGLAPEGWHIPSDAEWKELSNCLGGENVAGGKLKSMGTIEAGDGLWRSPNLGATNESGFSALPGGLREQDGTYDTIGIYGLWWSSKEVEYNSSKAWYWNLFHYYSTFLKFDGQKKYGLSVRCVKDD